MRRKGRRRADSAVLALAAAAFMGISVVPAGAAEPLEANPVVIPEAEDPGHVLIVNNHIYAVTVYAFTETGKRFRLGELSRSSAKVLNVPEEAVEGSSVLVKVYPKTPAGLGSAAEGNPGIKTRLPVFTNTPTVALWLEPNLELSYTQEVATTF